MVVFLKIRPLSSSEWLEISAGDHNQTRGMCLWVALAVGMSAAPGVPHSSPGSVIVAPNSVERHAGSARSEVRPSVWVLLEGAALAAFVGAHAPGAINEGLQLEQSKAVRRHRACRRFFQHGWRGRSTPTRAMNASSRCFRLIDESRDLFD